MEEKRRETIDGKSRSANQQNQSRPERSLTMSTKHNGSNDSTQLSESSDKQRRRINIGIVLSLISIALAIWFNHISLHNDDLLKDLASFEGDLKAAWERNLTNLTAYLINQSSNVETTILQQDAKSAKQRTNEIDHSENSSSDPAAYATQMDLAPRSSPGFSPFDTSDRATVDNPSSKADESEVNAQTNLSLPIKPVVSVSMAGDQYPSLIETHGLVTIGNEGTKFNMACGYDIDNGNVEANRTGNEITFQNMPGLVPGKSQADRFIAIETIDGVPVITSLAEFSNNPQVVTIEAVINGAPKTVSCGTSNSGTTVTECTKTNNLIVSPADMKKMEDLFASNCPKIVKKMGDNPNFNRGLYSRKRQRSF